MKRPVNVAKNEALSGNQCLIKVFVYGTLMRGYANHDYYCRGAMKIEPAEIWGRLYDLGCYPVLEVPEELILACGTADPVADAETQAQFAQKLNGQPELPRPEGDWELINGELVTFDNPQVYLPPIDGLESFNPESSSGYQRVLMLVKASEITPAWVYRVENGKSMGERIHGRWGCRQR